MKQGDTIKSIANKFGLKPRDLRAVNDIGKDVVVGQRLLIPARAFQRPETERPGRRRRTIDLAPAAPGRSAERRVSAGRSGTSWSRSRRVRSR